MELNVTGGEDGIKITLNYFPLFYEKFELHLFFSSYVIIQQKE